MNSVTTLVTGGGGFLGHAIVRQLVQSGTAVRTFSRHRYTSLGQLEVEQQRGDLRNVDDVRRACEGIETIYHTAALPGIWGDRRLFYNINTQGTLNLLAAAKQAGCQRLVYTSSPSVTFSGGHQRGIDESAPYPERWLCAYPQTKALAERAVLAANDQGGMRTCALRPHLIWGPGDPHLVPRLIERARSGRLRRIGRGDNRVDMIYVDNAAAAHIAAARALPSTGAPAGRAYFISQGAPVRLWDWIDDILQLADLPPLRRSIPLSLAYAAGALLETTYTIGRIRREPPMTRFLALQLGRDHYFSIAAAERDFGYAPAVSTAEGMTRLAAWLQRQQATDDSRRPVAGKPSVI